MINHSKIETITTGRRNKKAQNFKRKLRIGTKKPEVKVVRNSISERMLLGHV